MCVSESSKNSHLSQPLKAFLLSSHRSSEKISFKNYKITEGMRFPFCENKTEMQENGKVHTKLKFRLLPLLHLPLWNLEAFLEVHWRCIRGARRCIKDALEVYGDAMEVYGSALGMHRR